MPLEIFKSCRLSVDRLCEYYENRLTSNDFKPSHLDNTRLFAAISDLIRQRSAYVQASGNNHDEFFKLDEDVVRKAIMSCSKMARLLFVDDKQRGFKLVSVEDLEELHQEWDAIGTIVRYLPMCGALAVMQMGSVLAEIIEQLVTFIRHHRSLIVKKHSFDTVNFDAENKHCLGILNLLRSQFSTHWPCLKMVYDAVATMIKARVTESARQSIIDFLKHQGCRFGDFEVAGLFVAGNKDFCEAHIDMTEFIRWKTDRTDLYRNRPFIAVLDVANFGNLRSSSPATLELSPGSKESLRHLVSDVGMSEGTVYFVSSSTFALEEVREGLEHFYGVNQNLQLMSSDSEIIGIQQKLNDAMTDLVIEMQEVVLAISPEMYLGYKMDEWNPLMLFIVECGDRALSISQGWQTCEKINKIFSNAFNVACMWGRYAVYSYDDPFDAVSFQWGVAVLEKIVNMTSKDFVVDRNFWHSKARFEAIQGLRHLERRLHYLKCDRRTMSSHRMSNLDYVRCLQNAAKFLSLFNAFQNPNFGKNITEMLAIDTLPTKKYLPVIDFLSEYGFEVIREVGCGSSATVYHAVNLKNGDAVAIKMIDLNRQPGGLASSYTLALASEARLHATMKHDNIIACYDFTVEKGLAFMFLEFCGGGSLREHFKRNRLFGNAAAIKSCSKQILTGLAYLHGKHIVHGDLKPDNILVADNQEIKLADFGNSSVSDILRLAEGDLGTVAYTAPEILGGGRATSKSDIWSFCCTLFFLFTGRQPWSHMPNDWSIVYAVGTSKAVMQIPDLGVENDLARDLILRGLGRNPEDRPSALKLLSHGFFKKHW